MEKEILNLADASDLLSLPEEEVLRLLTEGELPGRRIGSHWYLLRQRLVQFIADVVPSTSVSAPAPKVTVAANALPETVLSPNWRCDKCAKIHPPEMVVCSDCGAVRSSPLLGFRLSRTTLGPGATPGQEIN